MNATHKTDREPPGSHRNPKGWHSRGYLPHFDSSECIPHVIFRCADSIPPRIIEAFPEDSVFRRRAVNRLLDKGFGTRPLQKADAAETVASVLKHYDSLRYKLLAWCIMPNHVHVALEILHGCRLGDTVRQWKSFSARKINRTQAVSGAFWARDYFDRYVRNEVHLAQTVAYIENNPVSAGLVSAPELWPWSSAFDAPCEPGGSRSDD